MIAIAFVFTITITMFVSYIVGFSIGHECGILDTERKQKKGKE